MDPTESGTATPVEVHDAPIAVAPDVGRRRPIMPVALVVVVLLAGGALFVSGYSLGRQSAAEPGTPFADDDAFRPFWDTYHTITGRYAGGDVDRGALVQGAIRGMIDALGDPYSSYLTSEEYRASLQSIGGEFEGIGAEIAGQGPDGSQGCATLGPNCRLMVVSSIEGSPAMRAGLQAGDLVLAADGVSFDGLTVDGARERIRGPKGSIVMLTVQRGEAGPFPLLITRDIIEQQEVVAREYAGGTVGYVQLRGFSDRAAVELHDAIAAHVRAGRSKLVLDLRGNPGGYVTAARSVASQFIGSGVIFYEQDAAGVRTPTEALPGGAATDSSIRLVCLVDRGTASASEIVAGALQDTGRATLVGETSFGKGTVQQWQELTGEGGAFRLTIARWLTPQERWIHGVGLVPEVTVDPPGSDVTPDQDPFIDRALEVLAGEGALHRSSLELPAAA